MAKRFVCVRLQSMNGVNLKQFQFEFDLTWMSFFQNARGKTYTRFGGRDDVDSESFLNRKALLTTMRRVLDLHARDAVQASDRYEPDVSGVRLPSDLPAMKKMLAKREESCIHCHDVKAAMLHQHHAAGTLSKGMVYTYPNPLRLGIKIDSEDQQEIADVVPDSPAAQAGLKSGDRLVESDGYRITTYADLTRVLELAPAVGSVPLTAMRGGTKQQHEIMLANGWRTSPDPSWRASLHMVGPGAGFWGRPAKSAERAKLQVGPDDLALKVTFVWAPHAKAAKVKVGDFITDLDGDRKDRNMRQFHMFLQLHRNWGDRITLRGQRNGKSIRWEMTLPEGPATE